MASPAVPAAGSPGGGSAAGPAGRCPSGAAAGARARTRRPAAAAASVTAGGQAAATTRSPGAENASMTRRAAAAVTGPPHGRPSRVPPGAGRPGQMLSGTPGPVPPAGAVCCRCDGPGRAGGKAVPGTVEGLCHGGWSRVPPLSALTLQKSGFRGLFSPGPRRNIRAAGITREISPGKISRVTRGRPRPFTPGHGPAVYLPCTWRSGAGQRPYLPGPQRQAGCAARRVTPGRAEAGGRRYIPGTRPVQAGYTAGRREVHRRSTPGQSGVAGWDSVPVRLAHLELSHG